MLAIPGVAEMIVLALIWCSGVVWLICQLGELLAANQDQAEPVVRVQPQQAPANQQR